MAKKNFVTSIDDLGGYPDEGYVQALLLAEVVKRILVKRAFLELSEKPAIVIKPITEFVKRMRVSSLGKFEEKTYIATINFFQNEEDRENNKAIGTVVSYLGEENIIWFLQKLEYLDLDEEDEDGLRDATGAFCNMVAGSFKNGLQQIGYESLEMSHFTTHINDVFEGVLYPMDQNRIYEISFKVRGLKCVVFDLVFGDVPKKNELNLSYFKN